VLYSLWLWTQLSAETVAGHRSIKYTLLYFQRYIKLPRIEKIIPISDFRKDAAGILDRLCDSREPYVITRRGRPAAVLVKMDDYERQQHDLELLRLLAQGEADIAAGRGYAMEDVLAEAKAIIDKL